MLTQSEQDIISSIPEHVSLNKSFIVKGAFKDVLTVERFTELLNLKPYITMKRFLLCHSSNRTGFTYEMNGWDTEPSSLPPDITQELIDEGMCYIRDASRVSKKVNDICSCIERSVGSSTDCHIYFARNPEHVNSFGIHKDFQHNLIIQVQGKTHWKVGSEYYKNEPQNLADFYENDNLSIDEVLDVGDAIFVPAFVYHKPENLTKRISCSFAFSAVTDAKPTSRHWVEW